MQLGFLSDPCSIRVHPWPAFLFPTGVRMPSRFVLAVAAVLALAPPAPAAVVVVANFTAADVTFTVAEPGGRPRAVKLAPGEARPVTVAGPADLTFPTIAEAKTVRVEPYHAYV